MNELKPKIHDADTGIDYHSYRTDLYLNNESGGDTSAFVMC